MLIKTCRVHIALGGTSSNVEDTAPLDPPDNTANLQLELILNQARVFVMCKSSIVKVARKNYWSS